MLLLSFACALPERDAGTVPAPVSPDDDTDVPAPAPPPSFEDIGRDGLTDHAEAAVALVPRWIRDDLVLALRQQENDEQDALAAVLLDLGDPTLIDEVAFAMAHLSPEVLDSRKFHPELLVENARMIYEVDPHLDYVRLVEEGEPGVDADWWTTTAYTVVVDGVVQEVTLDRELYYWYVVHPRIEDEHPYYVEAWEECTRSDLECHASPEEGTFWRSFLWSSAAETCPEGESCPVLSEHLPGQTVLWGDPDGNDAVHAIAAFMLSSPDDARWFSFGAYGERSIQPNRIYALGRGNCGEWADMTSALSRTALIPNVNVTPSSWDHTWNAFWQDRWYAWEPVNWWFDHPYGSGYATYATRGDTSVWYQSDQYTSTFELRVSVRDPDGEPVDGAAVAVFSPWEDSWWYAGEQGTGPDGVATLSLGADKEYAYMVVAPNGEFPGDVATAGTPAGEVLSVQVDLDGAMPDVPVPTLVEAGEADAHLAVTLEAEGRVNVLSLRFDETWTGDTLAPALDAWLMTEEAYARFEEGEDFEVLAEGLDADFATDEPRVLVVANLRSQSTAAVGTIGVTVSPLEGADFVETAAWTRELVLLPGEHVAVRISPG